MIIIVWRARVAVGKSHPNGGGRGTRSVNACDVRKVPRGGPVAGRVMTPRGAAGPPGKLLLPPIPFIRLPGTMPSPSRTLPISGVFNDGYIAELFETYRRDPSSVD